MSFAARIAFTIAMIAATPVWATCGDPAVLCGKLISQTCLSVSGAGALPAGAAADCGAQFAAYRDCLADIAVRCGQTPTAGAAHPVAEPGARLPADHAAVAEVRVGQARFSFILAPRPVSWSAAERIAAAMGGRLAVIDDAEKQAAIAEALSRRPELFNRVQVLFSGWYFGPWIGGYQQAGAKTPQAGWRWSLDPDAGASAPMGFANWYPGNPNDFGGPEGFAHFFCIDQPTCGTWNDTTYDADIRAYIVEFPT